MTQNVGFESGLGQPTNKKVLSVNPAVNGYLLNQRKIGQKERERWAPPFHMLCRRYSGHLTPIDLGLMYHGNLYLN